MSDRLPLWERMRSRAASHPKQAAEMLKRADEFEHATNGFYGDPQTVTVKQFLGAYARAKILWRDVTGEPLV